MSVEALSLVWNQDGVSSTEKLILIWIANNTPELGMPVNMDWISMAEFACCEYQALPEFVINLVARDLLVYNEDFGEACIAYKGEYRTGYWNLDPKGRKERLAFLIQRDGPECRYCGKEFPFYHIDHVMPRARGGLDHIDNLALACPPCNLSKGAKTLEEWQAGR